MTTQQSNVVTIKRQHQSLVLDQFHHLRGQILAVLNEGRQLGESLGPSRASIDPKFETARRAVDASRLNLVVIGAEGDGKSTLLNSILGEDLTPREEQTPGTVAPVYLEWSQDRQPVFSVMLHGKDKSVICRNADEFRRYLLQKENPKNEKQVLEGRVSYCHPILGKGLCLVDMPGVEGVSSEIASMASKFIKEEAHAVLAVVRDRGYGALVRTLSEIEGDDLRVQAVVSNWSLDVWQGKSDEALQEFLRTQKEIVSTTLKNDGDFHLKPSQVFVLHLLTFCGAPCGERPQVTSAVHQRESEAFETMVWDYVRSHGVGEVISDGAGKAEEALGELKGLLDIRLSVLTELMEGGTGAGTELIRQFERARSSAASAWQAIYDREIENAAKATWRQLKSKLDATRDRLIEKVDEIKAQVDAKEGKIRKPEATAIRSKMQHFMTAEFSRLRETQEELLKRVTDDFCDRANDVLEELFMDVPVIRHSAGGITVSTQGLINHQLSTMEPGLLDKLLKVGSIGSASIVSGILAGGSGTAWLVGTTAAFGPVGALVAGAIGGGLLAWGLIDWLRDEHRSAVLKGLEKCKTDIQAIDTSKCGKLRVTWGEAVAGVARSVDEYLGSQINNIAQIIKNPTSDMDRLIEQKQGVDASIGTVEDLLERLIEIGSAAGHGTELSADSTADRFEGSRQ